MTQRTIQYITTGRATSDGAGVRLTRIFGGPGVERFDPFLMLDEFGSDQPNEYIAGFPAHPHRGFETVTYMLEGRMRHEDHLGNVGLLEPGAVQWMTAARGVIHSEMPEQREGRMRGFQLWLNLPAKSKMNAPSYRDHAAEHIPRVWLPGGGEAIVIAGRLVAAGVDQPGAVQRPDTDPQLFDLHLPRGSHLEPQLGDGLRPLLYVYEGELRLGDSRLQAGQLAVLSTHGALRLEAVGDVRVLLVAGQPIGEPIVQYGPFVMNSRDEIEQALRDVRDGSFTN